MNDESFEVAVYLTCSPTPCVQDAFFDDYMTLCLFHYLHISLKKKKSTKRCMGDWGRFVLIREKVNR